MNDCNIDDIVCKLETLRHLRGLQEQIGKADFTKKFPELEALAPKIEDEIKNQKGALSSAVNQCNAHIEELIPPEEMSDLPIEDVEEIDNGAEHDLSPS